MLMSMCASKVPDQGLLVAGVVAGAVAGVDDCTAVVAAGVPPVVVAGVSTFGAAGAVCDEAVAAGKDAGIDTAVAAALVVAGADDAFTNSLMAFCFSWFAHLNLNDSKIASSRKMTNATTVTVVNTSPVLVPKADDDPPPDPNAPASPPPRPRCTSTTAIRKMLSRISEIIRKVIICPCF